MTQEQFNAISGDPIRMVTDKANEHTSLEVKCGKDAFLESPGFWKIIDFYFKSGLA